MEWILAAAGLAVGLLGRHLGVPPLSSLLAGFLFFGNTAALAAYFTHLISRRPGNNHTVEGVDRSPLTRLTVVLLGFAIGFLVPNFSPAAIIVVALYVIRGILNAQPPLAIGLGLAIGAAILYLTLTIPLGIAAVGSLVILFRYMPFFGQKDLVSNSNPFICAGSYVSTFFLGGSPNGVFNAKDADLVELLQESAAIVWASSRSLVSLYVSNVFLIYPVIVVCIIAALLPNLHTPANPYIVMGFSALNATAILGWYVIPVVALVATYVWVMKENNSLLMVTLFPRW